MNRVNALYPEEIDNEELNSLLTTIKNQGDEIEMKDKEIVRLKAKVEKMQKEEAKTEKKAVKTTKTPRATKKSAADEAENR